ncbi:sulfatase-like hydrolase/transferase [Poriferisphaera sp. WC338]|uniref:sulfatase-like hydrolase/transferase n=1 Tax=Poriferisphaera sp. WC338 TaxID=3425129 RepID=UPI003D81660F
MDHAFSAVLLSSIAIALPCYAETDSYASQPNVILILADDLGSRDLSVFGHPQIKTPNIDSIANAGVTFTQAYTTGAVCAPSRAGLLTGRYQHRFGFEDNPGPFRRTRDIRVGMDLDERTIASRLKAIGYTTGMIGKWHDGPDADFQPPARGFDEFYGFNNGAQRYLNVDSSNTPMMRGMVEEKHGEGYLTDTFGEESAAFIERNHEKPFFLYLSFNAPHGPMTANPEVLAEYTHIQDKGRRAYAAMIDSMDKAVGNVLEKLNEHKLTDNTVIIFLSDHGGVKKKKAYWGDNGHLRGGKGTLWDGGLQTPIFIQWNDRITPGSTYNKPVIALDLLPTIVEACGGEIDSSWKLDGVNLLPYLSGEKTDRPHETFYWRQNEMWAVRDGDWKILRDRGAKVPQLFNLARDPGEKVNLAEVYPDKLDAMVQLYEAWAADVETPRFGWWSKIGPRVED